jgi:hypothetical protein
MKGRKVLPPSVVEKMQVVVALMWGTGQWVKREWRTQEKYITMNEGCFSHCTKVMHTVSEKDMAQAGA